MTISELDESGRQFLIQLFEQTRGDTSAQVSMYDLGKDIGLDRDTSSRVAEDLIGLQLVEIRTLSGGIGISAEGAGEVKRLMGGAAPTGESHRKLTDQPIMPKKKKKIKLISWNVNGLRAVIKKEFFASFNQLDADIFAIQETKLQEHQLTDEMKNIAGYETSWSHATVKKGYSGVGTYSRIKPRRVNTELGISKFDQEGRIIELEFDHFNFFNVYFPNGQMSAERLEYKLDFYEKFFEYTDSLKSKGRGLIITGDYNTAHNEIDLKNPQANQNTSGFLRIERDWLDRITQKGYVDTFRHFFPDIVKYSWWTYRFKARDRNIGWRIDYFFVTEDMIKKGWIKEAFIENNILGSDHCPIGLVLEY